MSMTMQLRRARQDVLAELSDKGEGAYEFVDPPDQGDSAFGDGTILNIDKAWHAINFLLSRTNKGADKSAGSHSTDIMTAEMAWNSQLPYGFLLGGAEVGAEMEYGAVRVLQPAEVVEVSELLTGLPDEFIETELDFASLQEADVYPDIWDRRDPDDLQYVSSYFRNLREFIATAARAEEGIAQVLI